MTHTPHPHRTFMADHFFEIYNAETQPMPILPAIQDPEEPKCQPGEKHPGKAGKIGWALLWLMGIPVPILLLFFLMRGCT